MNYQNAIQLLDSFKTINRREYSDIADKNNHAGTYFFKRTQFLLDIMGNPEETIPHYLHIAGTSGKGSVCAYLSSMWCTAGRKTGLFLSPYISDIRERWQINNQPISKTEFIILVQEIKTALETYIRTSPYDVPSLFEIYTVMSLRYFAKKKVDYAVLEVGMGGRLDSTNIIKRKDAAIITDIGLDHTKHLGTTISQIAREKAGIITGSAPVFTMTTSRQALKIIKQAVQRLPGQKTTVIHSALSPAEKKTISISETGTNFTYHGNDYQLKALGTHQSRDAALAITVAEHFGIDQMSIRTGLKKTVQPIRFEIVNRNPHIILDGAHNPQKIWSTVETLKNIQLAWPKKSVHLVLGFSGDKNTHTMIKELATLKPATVACTKNITNLFRKTLDPGNMQKTVKKYSPGAKTEIFLDPMEAVTWSKKQAGTTGIILITGSIFLSGELRAKLTKKYLG